MTQKKPNNFEKEGKKWNWLALPDFKTYHETMLIQRV